MRTALPRLRRALGESVVVVVIAIGIVVLVSVAIIRVQRVNSKIKCVHEGEPGEAGTNWCQKITDRQAEIAGLQIQGVYDTPEECAQYCSRTNKGPRLARPELTGTVYIEELAADGTWVIRASGAVWNDEPDLSFTNTMAASGIFRGRYEVGTGSE